MTFPGTIAAGLALVLATYCVLSGQHGGTVVAVGVFVFIVYVERRYGKND